MASNDSSPMYVLPCLREETKESLESDWLSSSDFGECYIRASDEKIYPCLNPIYNGKVLNIDPDLIHAGLSGISIKHYNGKCYQESEEKDYRNGEILWGEDDGEGLFDDHWISPFSLSKTNEDGGRGDFATDKFGFTKNDSSEYQENLMEDAEFLRPICARPRMNFRNSFWNLHRPELCKLTWSQKYVSRAIVIEHLHEHLTDHGFFCAEYHEEEDRVKMLDKELDEYGRLKELASPRKIPPDEKLFNFKMEEQQNKNPRCRGFGTYEKKIVFNPKDRFFSLSDDEEVDEEKNIHRSKEEFCITIGKHVRKPVIRTETPSRESFAAPEMCFAAEEEEGGVLFYYNWLRYPAEESYEEASEKEEIEKEVEVAASVEPCPPLIADEFCRAAGKADFSDLRCNPDDF